MSAAKGWLQSAIVQALDAVEDGDARVAAAFLRSALHPTAERPYRCVVCGATFRWPGEIDDHERPAHPWRGHPWFADDEGGAA